MEMRKGMIGASKQSNRISVREFEDKLNIVQRIICWE
jgi:hypothetical protein